MKINESPRSMKISIRPIQESDNASLSMIIKGVFVEFNAPKHGTVYSDPTTDNLFRFFQKDKSICWVGEINGQVMGCCGIYPTPGLDENCCELVKFYLIKESRGIGLGKQLMNQCEASAIDYGYQQIYIESMPEFETAVGMYEKAGYIRLTRAKGNSGHFGCSLFMIKNII